MINTNPTLIDYWNFITHNNSSCSFEVRIKNYDWLKVVATKLEIPYSKSGVYVNDYLKLFRVIKLVREKQTVWISVNPKRKSFYENQKFKSFNGTDASIEQITNIMIDIDRKVKGKLPASPEQKLLINKLSSILLKDLEKLGVATYMKVDSGNGIQIVIPVEPLWLPEQVYDEKTQTYVLSDVVEKYKNLVKSTFGAMVMRKYNSHEIVKEYNAEIDESSFNIGRVMALHGSLNLKYELPILRRAFFIKVEESNMENKGLMSAMLKNLDDVVPTTRYITKNKYNIDILGEQKNYTIKTIYNSPLVKLLLSRRLPEGDRNRSLILPLKILLNKNNIDLRSPEVQKLRQQIESVQGGSFPFNSTKDFMIFSTNTITKYCVNNFIELPYEILPQYGYKEDMLMLINDPNYKHIFSYANFDKRLSYTNYNIELIKDYESVYNMKELTNSLYENLILLNKNVERAWLIYNKNNADRYNEFNNFLDFVYKSIFEISKIYSVPQKQIIVEMYAPRFLSKQIEYV